jgi:general secretion pathway protein K
VTGTAQPHRERGFALLLVIWVLTILAVLAAGFAASTRSETRLARNLLEAARARAWAEAGIARATASLLEVDPRARWPADGTPQAMRFDGADISVKIEDEDGKIDLNLAPTELLAGLCAEIGIADDTCAGLVEGVTARRRAATPAAAPGIQAPRFGAPAAKPDRQSAAFTTVEELCQLPALDPASFARLRPFVTVYAQSERIDPAVAPREVLLAIPGVDPGEVERLLNARAAAAQTLAPLPVLTGAEPYLASGQLHAATIIATARSETGASFSQRSVIALTGQPLTPVQVLEWRQQIEEDAAE